MNKEEEEFQLLQKFFGDLPADAHTRHGYKGDGKHGCNVNIGNANNPQRCGAGMFQHLWVAEFYGDDDE